MAKLALTLTLFIALFLFTGARHPLDLPDDDSSSIHHQSITLPEPESKRTILLPSENPESEHLTLVELEPHVEEEEEEAHEMDNEHEADQEMVEEAVQPEKRFVWTRDGDERRMFMVRHPHHRCHHPHRRPHLHHPFLFHQFEGKLPMPEFERRERSYGNDMLVAEPEMEKRVEQKTVSFADDMLMEKGPKEETVSFGDDTLVADPEKGLKGKAVAYGDDMLLAEPEMEKGKTVSYGNDMLVAETEGEKGFGFGGLEQDLTEVKVGGHRHAPSRWVGLHFGGGSWFDPEHEHGPHHHHHHHHDSREEEDERRPDGHHHDDERRPHGHHHDDERRLEGHRPEDQRRLQGHRPEDERRLEGHHPEDERRLDGHRPEDERRLDGYRPEDERRPDGHRHVEEHRHGRREEGGGGLVKRFRKFLHHIEF